jgi:broad specificity phosphatase PhoE
LVVSDRRSSVNQRRSAVEFAAVGILLLIRHGQASFDAEEYDVLSPAGVAQSALLGTHLAASAPLAARGAGAMWPEPIVLDELDEFPFQEVLRLGIPQVMSDGAPIVDPRGGFSRAFHEAMLRWADGRIAGDFERYPDFVARVGRALDRIVDAEGRGRRVAVVTSGGPIAVAVQRALELSPPVAIRVQSVIANASLSELKYRAGELTLTAFNGVHHLAPAQLITYR